MGAIEYGVFVVLEDEDLWLAGFFFRDDPDVAYLSGQLQTGTRRGHPFETAFAVTEEEMSLAGVEAAEGVVDSARSRYLYNPLRCLVLG